jgi:MerR family mercuric resistance operon transcriptional regulator
MAGGVPFMLVPGVTGAVMRVCWVIVSGRVAVHVLPFSLVEADEGSLNSVPGYGVKETRMQNAELTIARLAEDAGVGVETVRYYERRGLIRQPEKRSGAYRRYGLEHVKRIRFVKRAQELGFTLEEVETLLKLQDGANRAEVRRVASARREQIRARMADLRRMERVLTHLLEECEAGKTPHCPIIETLGGSKAAPK